uniref:(northern house mosquito) hypothetical protein n=1 Tax=Culex pipiens TaxID=7175 RepID=A0A8D8AK54_CULPI
MLPRVRQLSSSRNFQDRRSYQRQGGADRAEGNGNRRRRAGTSQGRRNEHHQHNHHDFHGVSNVRINRGPFHVPNHARRGQQQPAGYQNQRNHQSGRDSLHRQPSEDFRHHAGTRGGYATGFSGSGVVAQ